MVFSDANVQTLYMQGARKFLVFNVPPEGCATIVLLTLDGLGLPTDDLGCIIAINEINQALHRELFKSVQHLRASLPLVTITYFDYYAANTEILTNPSKYGFNPDTKFVACCGAPGQGEWNFNVHHQCGSPGVNSCSDPDSSLVWDGVHWTEAFYRHIAKFVLNGAFSDPPTNITEACNLSFEDFDGETFDEVFPSISSGTFSE